MVRSETVPYTPPGAYEAAKPTQATVMPSGPALPAREPIVVHTSTTLVIRPGQSMADALKAQGMKVPY